jgi:protocatechuate 3,4-dioxygenase beta subunit
MGRSVGARAWSGARRRWESAESARPLSRLSAAAQAALTARPDAAAMSKRTRLLRRREALTLAGLGLTGALGARASGVLGPPGAEAAGASCILSPEVTEGPYWIDNKLSRRDITEDRPGLPLELVLTVQNAKTCSPIKGADVEIWHCDAGGVYSGYESGSPGGPGGGHATPTDPDRFLRGHQRADADGRARFLTIYPGWYRGRTPHIHLKVHVGGSVVHTGQVFFDERTTAAVYRHTPYRSHGQPDTSHAQDMIYAQAGRSRATLKLARRSHGRKGYRGTITLAVAT